MIKAGNAASTSQSNNTASLTEKVLPTVTGVPQLRVMDLTSKVKRLRSQWHLVR